MNTRPLVIAISVFLMALSCGKSKDEYAVAHKLAKIAILEDSREMGRGELLDYLNDTDPEIRARSVIALGRIGWRQAAPQIGKLVSDSAEAVRLEAAFALGQLGDSSGIFPIASNLKHETSIEVKCAMIEALGKIGDPVVTSTVVQYVSDPDPQVRGSVALALARLRQHNRSSDLIQLSRDADGEVRWKAVYGMMRSADSTAVERLRWCLKDSVATVRLFAARALGEIGDSAGLNHLTDRLRLEPNDNVKVNLIRSIASVGDRRALKSLLNILSEDESNHTKAEAVAAIGKLGLDKALSKVLPFSHHESWALRGAAIVTIAQIDPDLFMDSMVEYVEDGDWYVKSRILDGLAAVGTDEAFDSALAFVSDEDPRVRGHALDIVSEFDHRGVAEHLRSALGDPDLSVKIAAINAIASRKDTSCIGQLAVAYSRHGSDSEADLRLSVAQALSSLIDSTSPDPAMLDILNEALNDPNYHVRKAAIGAFEKIGTDQASHLGGFETMITAANYGETFRRYADNPTAIIETNRGDIKIKLLYEIAPKTVNNFVDLAESGYYDGKIWCRVIPAFVIQDGCPTGDGEYGPGYTIRCEYSREPYVAGTVGMAHAGKDTGAGQFFIAHTVQPHLVGRYTVFGRVESGMRVVNRIEVGDSIRTIEVISNDRRR